MNEGWANCSRLFSIDTHELPFGSIPPVAPALAISSAGLAPNAAEDKRHTKAMTTMNCDARSARPRWRFEKRCANQELLFDVFISRWSSSFLVSRKLAPFCASAGYLQHASARFTDPTR